jgi:lipoprotein-anchoring transpeptidase ErfK/SrfK
VLRRALRREIVPVLEERNGFARVGESQWIERQHLRVAKTAPPPAGIRADEQWIDIDLDEQVLVAYEGTKPVFTTLVSSGKKGHSTPPGTYRVRAKAATTLMAGDPKAKDRYQVSEVPWAVRFRSGLFIHGVYWHDGFGAVLSHGCVNVSPRDAMFLYDWVVPSVPDGWSEVEVPPGAGVTVRLRSHDVPDPPAFDYRDEEAKN